MIHLNFSLSILVLCIFVGCDAGSSSMPVEQLSVGSWTFGKDPDYERIQSTILEADAIINLNADQTIEWYDWTNESFLRIASIEKLRGRLESISGRSLITIGTERNDAKESELAESLSRIFEFAKELGYRTAVVVPNDVNDDDEDEIVVEISQVVDLTK